MTVCAWCGARAHGGAATYARAVCPECLRDLLEHYAEGRAETLRRDETAARVAQRGRPQVEGGRVLIGSSAW